MPYSEGTGTLSVRIALAAAIAFTLSGCNSDSSDSDDNASISKPAKPAGTGSEFAVPAADSLYPAPATLYASNNADGTLRWVLNDNPIAYLLRDINRIWKGTSDAYQQGASGDGPSDYLDDPIVDAAVWQANIQYVVDVTTERTDDQAIHAFLDDVRSKNYSVIDGYGPLTEAYVAHSGAYVDVPVPTVDQVLQDVNFGSGNNDGIAWAGSKTSELGAVVTLVDAFRQRAPASTNASKYIFSTPRPWRMTDTGAIDFLGTANHNCYDVAGNLTVQLTDQYTTSVKLVPGLTCAQRPHSSGDHTKGLYTENTENRRKDGGYPSGHTNAGYLAAMAYAYALPQRYAEMLTRGSQLGENRIVAGMHSPVDVIGGRVHAMMVAAYALAQPDILADATAAYDSAQGFFGQLAAEQDLSLYELAHQPVTNEAGRINGSMVNTEVFNTSQYDDHEANKALYRFRMTYELGHDEASAGQDPIVPDGAEALLLTRQPYLSDEQRRAVLYTTSIDSGYPLLDATNGWGRLDLVTAADGYGAFLADVAVDMDASQGGFHARDWWRNDISGSGRLSKSGSGELVLSGDNSYTGGTLISAGTLRAESTNAFGEGDLYLEDGRVVVDVEGALAIAGNLTLDAGTLELRMADDGTQVTVGDIAYIDGATLKLDFSDLAPASGSQFVLLSANQLSGTFSSVESDVAVDLSYSGQRVTATVR